MKFTETKLKGAYILEPNKIEDSRGFFGRLWCEKEMLAQGLESNLRQSNVSKSKFKGTLRGMHFQREPFQETKLVRCTKGSVFDVIIDLRPDSITFKQWFGQELNEDNYKMMYVPKGFAHGFLTLQDDSEVYYLVTEFYNSEFENGVRHDDTEFNIKWPIAITEISDKDATHPNFDKNKSL